MIQRFALILAAVFTIDAAASAIQTLSTVTLTPTADNEIARQAQRLFKGYEEAGLFSGAVLVARGDQVLFRNAAGLANAEFQVQNTVDTRFRIVSISQLFTVAAILRLQELGRLSVQDAAGKHMTGWPDTHRGITIHQLLVGASGVKDVTQIPDFVRSVAVSRNTEGLATIILREPVAPATGPPTGPNNSAFHLLAAIVERVAGMSFTEYVRREIINRAGLAHTSHDDPAAVIARRAAGYTINPDGLQNAAWFHMDNAVGMANLSSTVGDVHRFIRALVTAKIVSKASLDLIVTDHVQRDPLRGDQGPAIGYGINIMKTRTALQIPTNAIKDVYHAGNASSTESTTNWNTGGTINGFQSGLWYSPEQELLIVILSNVVGNGAPTNMMNALTAIAAGRNFHIPVARTMVTPRPEDLRLLSGLWTMDNAFVFVNGQRRPSTLSVRVEGNRLFVRSGNGFEYEWYAEGPGRFFAKHADSQIELKQGSTEEATYVISGRQSPMRRRSR